MALLPRSKKSYLKRYIDIELDDLTDAKAIALEGAKGVGKSETATRRVNTIYKLDDANERALVQADLNSALSSSDTICLDEWQHLPPVWDAVRRNVDAHVDTKYFLTGSATPSVQSGTHSGAGRILSLRMRPLSLAERNGTTPTVWVDELFERSSRISGETKWTVHDYAEAICSSGLPGIYTLSGRLRRQQLSSYIQRAIDRDVADQGLLVRKPQALRQWWAAYAAASSTTTNYSKLLDAATPGDPEKLSKNTAMSYREVLDQLWLLDPVPAWFPNYSPFKRLTTASKHQVFDPGVAAALLDMTPEKFVSKSPGSWELFGQLFESLATLTVRVAGQAAEARTAHLRTQQGRQEVDLILERYDGRVLAFEVKLKPTPTDRDVRHLHWLEEQIGDRLADKLVITSGRHAYRRPDGVAVVPLSLLG